MLYSAEDVPDDVFPPYLSNLCTLSPSVQRVTLEYCFRDTYSFFVPLEELPGPCSWAFGEEEVKFQTLEIRGECMFAIATDLLHNQPAIRNLHIRHLLYDSSYFGADAEEVPPCPHVEMLRLEKYAASASRTPIQRPFLGWIVVAS